MGKKSFALPYIIWMIGFTVIPLLMILYYGLTDGTGAFTLANVTAIATAEHSKALWLSVGLSFISTVICLILAYPLAMILKGMSKHSNSLIVFIFILPMWMNSLLRTMAWQTILSNQGLLNMVLSKLGLPTVNIINTTGAIIFGMVYDFLPFMVLPIYNALVKISQDKIDAARDLGANSAQTLVKVIFPLSMPGVISGITMVFVPSMTTFVISTLLGGGKILLIGNVIEQAFTTGNDRHLGSGLSLVLMVFILLSMAILNKYDPEGSNLA
jgi:spermidine/putrescine transport system permease protein